MLGEVLVGLIGDNKLYLYLKSKVSMYVILMIIIFSCTPLGHNKFKSALIKSLMLVRHRI